jgi:hypothetical protein
VRQFEFNPDPAVRAGVIQLELDNLKMTAITLDRRAALILLDFSDFRLETPGSTPG